MWKCCGIITCARPGQTMPIPIGFSTRPIMSAWSPIVRNRHIRPPYITIWPRGWPAACLQTGYMMIVIILHQTEILQMLSVVDILLVDLNIFIYMVAKREDQAALSLTRPRIFPNMKTWPRPLRQGTYLQANAITSTMAVQKVAHYKACLYSGLPIFREI